MHMLGCGWAALLMLLVPAMAGAEPVTVRVEFDDEVVSWDPHSAWHLTSITAFRHVYETLVHIGPELRLEPGLATEWRMAEPTAYELDMRPGVRFQDGTGCCAGGYTDPQMNAFLDQIAVELSTPLRDALIERVWRVALDEVVHIPLYREVQPWLMRDRLDLPADPRLI